MGAVHGVYLKYVGLSAVSFAGYQMVMGNIGPMGKVTYNVLQYYVSST